MKLLLQVREVKTRYAIRFETAGYFPGMGAAGGASRPALGARRDVGRGGVSGRFGPFCGRRRVGRMII